MTLYGITVRSWTDIVTAWWCGHAWRCEFRRISGDLSLPAECRIAFERGNGKCQTEIMGAECPRWFGWVQRRLS